MSTLYTSHEEDGQEINLGITPHDITSHCFLMITDKSLISVVSFHSNQENVNSQILLHRQ